MTTVSPKTIYLEDYSAPDYLVDTASLRFELSEKDTIVDSKLMMRRNGDHQRVVELHGVDLVLDHLRIDAQPVDRSRYQIKGESLSIDDVPARFCLEIRTRIRPQDNTSLEGLYKSSGNFCTQCEAEGFRKITYYPDRPDVMARFSTTIVADRGRYPVLLSNGNPVEHGENADGRHWVTWEDPYPKPSYLFALVAGDLGCVEDVFVTRSGREVRLRIFVEHHNRDKCDHAMSSLKKAMRWDEETYGLEYDLDIFMIVAVDDFNMGAMENKGLNIFNSKYVLANPQTATDDDFAAIEAVIAHEYFHNWTGNRVTCRDWFQLSLKEGLTVFRDQQFSADTQSRTVNRIQNVRSLRTAQFAEDAGPMAHPVRPASYMEINNFYTLTVYEKGAEVIRMMHTLLGDDGFRRGMDLYFQRHDGEAVTTDDFARAMEDASGVSLAQFRRWYDQAGTPRLAITGQYDDPSRSYAMEVEQSCPATPGQPTKEPFHIPLSVGLLDSEGRELPLVLAGEDIADPPTTRVLDITEAKQRFTFTGIPETPVASLLRDFSAPVKLSVRREPEELAFLAAHDPNQFNRWDAGQENATTLLSSLIEKQTTAREPVLTPAFAASLRQLLVDPSLDPALAAEAMRLPSEVYLAEQMTVIDVDAIHEMREFVRASLARSLEGDLRDVYSANHTNASYEFGPDQCARRKLKNVCLGLLMELDDESIRVQCLDQFTRADNMTDQLAAFRFLADTDCEQREVALNEFIERWADDALVLDKWFTTQAISRRVNALSEVKQLLHHEKFSMRNPNKVRSLVGAFCFHNQVRFHHRSGEGYQFLADQVLELDPVNPQVAARLLSALAGWRKFDASRRQLMKTELERVVATPGLSRDTFEIASKTLG